MVGDPERGHSPDRPRTSPSGGGDYLSERGWGLPLRAGVGTKSSQRYGDVLRSPFRDATAGFGALGIPRVLKAHTRWAAAGFGAFSTSACSISRPARNTSKALRMQERTAPISS